MNRKALASLALLAFVLLSSIAVAVSHDISRGIPFGPYACENAQGHSPLPVCNQ